MSYTVLARKYRPQKFSEVIGQEHVTRTLQNAIEQGRRAHGDIFSGHRGSDEIRELREAARYRPARDRFKIYILDEAHQITDAAFNALLKTLEEPPSHVVFMMATTQPEDIPQTIRSRCQHFSFRAVRFEAILGQLKDLAGREGIEADEDALALLAEAGDGSISDALW